jgi:tetratricopeptide (TPR) repeat protein
MNGVALLLLSLLLWPVSARAGGGDAADARRYFEAGAAAYAAGDYQAAVQALDAAYRLQPVAAIAFSLAQAERRQYFVSQEPRHLQRAIELYRAYLADVPTGGRRADATDALAQLEPIALARNTQPRPEGGEPAPLQVTQTRLMVRCQSPGARVSLDSGPAVAAPLITETTAGGHHVRVDAPGFFPAEQDVTTVAGELVPIEVALREKPALLVIAARDGAEVYVDGVPASLTGPGDSVSLRAGPHRVVFTKKGYRPHTVLLTLERGETRETRPELRWTKQRGAAVSLLIAGGASVAAGAVFTGLAVGQEGKASDIEAQRGSGSLTPAELDDYQDAVDARDRWRALAVGSFVVGASALLTGFVLYQFDDPDPREAPSRAAFRLNVRPEVGGGVSLALSGRL